MSKKIQNLFIYTITFVFITCCASKTDSGEEVQQKKEVKQETVQNINLFLETSASMGGYFKGNTEFIKNIPNLLVEIENRVDFKKKSINIKYIADNIQSYKGSTKEFIHDISTTKVALGKSSQMDKIFEKVTDATGTDDVSILISDCILSYPDKDIKSNPEINRQKADGELKAFIKDAFLKIKKRNVCASIYGFNSKFFGTYYNYQNRKIFIKGDLKRPYYLWIIGRKQQILQVTNQLKNIEGFKPEMAIDFGMFEKPINNFQVLFKTERNGKWRLENSNLSDVEIEKNKSIKFAITTDLTSLPEYATQKNYLINNLSIVGKDLKCKIADIKKTSEIDLSKAAPKEKEFIQNATHVIIFEVSDIFKSSAEIKLTLPLKYDTKYTDWSIMDDKNKAVIGGKTFAFIHLVDGVREAYQNNNDKFVNISITLKQ